MNVVDERTIRELFVAPVSACIASPDMYDAALFVEEEDYIRKAVPGRRKEYAAGRAAARKALACAGGHVAPIVADADRSPRWPMGFSGSITHCEGFCSAVVARVEDAAALGFDAELSDPLGADVHHLVCRTKDIEHFRRLPRVDGVDWPKLAFSAKESFYKCYYPTTRSLLGFRDVSVAFSIDAEAPARGTFSVVLEDKTKPMPRDATAFEGRWLAMGERVYTGVTLPFS
jgi:4'-phosphopantetheinyl transferase EntD